MTNRTSEQTLVLESPAGLDLVPVAAGNDRSFRRACLVAGTGLMVMAALAGFGNLVVLEGLVTPGDATSTAGDVLASESLFRLGVGALYVIVVLDVVIAWALLRVFSPVSRDFSRLAAWLRLAYAAVFLGALAQLAGVPDLLGSDASGSAFSSAQSDALALLKIDTFHDIWLAGLVLFGGHLLILGYLAYRSSYMPKALGVLLAIAGVGYAFDSFASVLMVGSPVTISGVTFLGELLLGVWLLTRGRRLSLGEVRDEI